MTPQDTTAPAVDQQHLVRLCRRRRPEGRDFKLIPQRVCWSGDTIDVCSACGMDVYDREWSKHHSEEMLEMAEPNTLLADPQYSAQRPVLGD